LIYSNEWNDHIRQLELALNTLQENRISCSPMKTEIGWVGVKDKEFKWTPECQKELAYLKTCLTSDPILKPIDLNRDLDVEMNCEIWTKLVL